MAVYYRYRSGVDTFSVPVPAPSITVTELKRLIMGTSRHGHGRTRGRGPREGIVLSNAQTGEEYTDGSALVPRNSTVVVRRVAGPPAETIVASSPRPQKAAQDGSSSDSSGRSSASTGAEDDEEGKAISAVIDAAQLKCEDPSQGARCYGRRGAALDGKAPPAGYVCHRCRVPGHFIQHCPTNGDPRFDLRRATATPVIPPARVPSSPDDGIPVELHCKICKKVMADAVVTSKCCFDSFCDRCIRDRIVASSKCVCGAQARADDLIPNPTIRTTITNMIARRAGSASGRTENPRSSAGKDEVAEEPTSQSAAASQESRSHFTSEKAAALEHSDGSGSTSKSAMTSVALDPRKEEEKTDTADACASHADHYGYGVPFAGPACYGPFFGGMPWAADPYMYYGGGYPMGPYHDSATGNMPGPPLRRDSGSYGYRDERRGWKRTRASPHRDYEDWRHAEHGIKRSSGSRSRVALVLT